MKDLSGKTAVVTGGGSGIGRGTVLALADAGMHVVVADIAEQDARTVADEAAALGPRAIGMRTDVTDKASVEALADKAYEEFGAVHVLHNNAGVFVPQRIDKTTDAEWKWILSVNLDGVINGIQVFLPRLQAQDDDAHIVNTASMAGHLAGPNLGAYNASKFAVVAISETLASELAGTGIGVSVLCPGGVQTNIFKAAMEQRPPGGAEMQTIGLSGGLERMMDPMTVGKLVRTGIQEDELYVFTHPEFGIAVQMRYDNIMQSFARWTERRDAARATSDRTGAEEER
jgi:NAD(P)-dependent dehydrogenase (short-subunit alcohol dehydrogenase family)